MHITQSCFRVKQLITIVEIIIANVEIMNVVSMERPMVEMKQISLDN